MEEEEIEDILDFFGDNDIIDVGNKSKEEEVDDLWEEVHMMEDVDVTG